MFSQKLWCEYAIEKSWERCKNNGNNKILFHIKNKLYIFARNMEILRRKI